MADLIEKYIAARQSNDRRLMAELLSDDCVTTLNDLEQGPDQIFDVRDWVEPDFIEKKQLKDVLRSGDRCMLRWDIQIWSRRDMERLGPENPPHQTIGMEFLEIREGKISRRWMAFDASYHMKQKGW